VRWFVAILLLWSLLVPPVGAEEALVFDAAQAPPSKAADLTWRYNGYDTYGVWLTDQQIHDKGVELLTCRSRLDTTIDGLAKCQVDLATAQADVSIPSWVWIGIGVVLGGTIVYGVSKL
jgi:hypothetical protein